MTYQTALSVLYALKESGPLYTVYSNNHSGHAVVITGCDSVKNIVYTNNPWGVSGYQSWSDFEVGFVSFHGELCSSYPLESIYTFVWY